MLAKVSIREAQKAADTASSHRKKITKLYVDFLHYTRRGQELYLGRCKERREFGSFECCTEHRVLALASQELRNRAKEITPQCARCGDLVKDKGWNCMHMMSETWWSDQGIDHKTGTVVVD